MSDVVEIAAGGGRRVLALGESVELDGRVSWVPPGTTGHQAVNAYLVLDGDAALLVDTGLAAHRDAVLAQLAAVLPASARLSIFFTRPLEFNCTGNLGAIVGAHDVDEIYLGGISSPLDSYDLERPKPRAVVVRPGDPLALGADDPLEIISPAVRILVTHWLYEPCTRTLFTSDLFSHTITERPQAPAVLDDAADETWTVQDVRDHLTTKVWWLTHSPTAAPARSMRQVFAEHDVAVIAPTFGRAIRGREQVARHVDLLLQALDTETPEPRIEAHR